ncbi:putative rRNA pseudouridine synthase [Viridothelium virens]|uniref:H/ACA ribonucleoprotein complex subunit CBF5 n=1 Tax=Viridothelium virens TaxID=1048519 RepID=A0A6A6HMM4_VIRVR|nr:putative rRNA pseudouridine synthase [Viridothelium virens]
MPGQYEKPMGPPSSRPRGKRPRHTPPRRSPPKHGQSGRGNPGPRYTPPRSTPPRGGLGYRGGRSPEMNYKRSRNQAPIEKAESVAGEDDEDRGPSAVANEESVKYGGSADLLHDQDKIKEGSFYPLEHCGFTPDARPLAQYLDYGCINLDKPANPSSHEVVSWVKKILPGKNLKTGHSGTLDPKVTGCLTVCIGKATRLVKSQQRAGKNYICAMRLHERLADGKNQILRALEQITGAVFQRPPIISAVKRVLRVRTIYSINFIEYVPERKMVIFTVDCEAGTYIRTLCLHLGYLLGTGAHMQELRRIRSGNMSEQTNLSTLHDLKEAVFVALGRKDERHLRTVVMPLEILLTHLKRIVIKDTCVGSICHGAKLSATGIVRFDLAIQVNEEIVLVSVKGEAVALAYAKIAGRDVLNAGHGLVATLKRVIMDREMYHKRWGMGKMSQAKKQMKEMGQLDQYGRVNEKTPVQLARLIENASGPPSTPSLPAVSVPVMPNQLPPASSFFMYTTNPALPQNTATDGSNAQTPSPNTSMDILQSRFPWHPQSGDDPNGLLSGYFNERISPKAQKHTEPKRGKKN